MKTTDTHVYFWRGIFSNWDKVSFKDPISDLNFSCTEQAFMFWKARQFKDFSTSQEIAAIEYDPQKAKKLGRTIKNYNQQEWDEVKFGIMVMVNQWKFEQNPSYAETLKLTENKILVEASPYDKIWGVGLEENNDLILDEKNWLGENLLGKALMEVRKKISNENN